MEVRTSPMELVSPSASPINQVIKTMHPPANSTTINQQSHLPQNLSTIHSNQNTAHNFSSSHTFSLNMSTNSAVSSLNPEQSISKNIVPTNQANATEQSISDKSQTNGTSGAEPSPVPYSLVSKEKEKAEKILPAVVPPTQSPQVTQAAQNLVVEPPAVVEKSPEVSAPVNVSKSNTIDAVVAKITQPSSESKPPQDSPQKKNEVTSPTPAAIPKDKRDHATTPSPNKKTETETVKTPTKQNAKPEPVPESPKSEEQKPQKNAEHKTSLAVDSAKDSPKESPEPKTPSKTPRKTKSGQNAQAGTSGTPLMLSASAKRHRIRTQHYQSPLPEVELVSKISTSTQRNTDEKLIVFYKNEFLAVRNAEGGFYLCQATQNIYKTSSKIKIRWLSQTENQEKGEIYTPDFYDLIEFDCILTNLSLSRADKGKFLLPLAEKTRTESILNRSLAVEKGEEIQSPSLTEEHPDGLDLSLYRDEDQLKKRRARKRRRAPPVRGTKVAATKVVPEASKVRKVAPPAKELPKKALVASKKPLAVPSTSKRVATREVKAVAETTKTNKNASKPSTSNAVKTSPVVDQKKAKVLARIGRKTAIVSKATKNNSKNGKSGNKPTSTVQKTAQAVKSTSATTRGLRKSTRK